MTFDGAQAVMPVKPAERVGQFIGQYLGSFVSGVCDVVVENKPTAAGLAAGAVIGALLLSQVNGMVERRVPKAPEPVAAAGMLPTIEARPNKETSVQVSAGLGALPQTAVAPVAPILSAAPALPEVKPAAVVAVVAPRISHAEMEAVAACLILEAANQGREGKHAVMNVIMNRALGNPENFFPVIEQELQFSCFNELTDRRPDGGFAAMVRKAKKDKTWDSAMELVQGAVTGELPDITDGADHYYKFTGAGKVYPAWAPKLEPTKNIGAHRFMKVKEDPKNPLRNKVWARILVNKNSEVGGRKQALGHTGSPEVAQ